jgi:TadE-like protein
MRVIDHPWPWEAALRRLRGTPEGERGQAIVEFAFLAPPFIAILCAILEFSGIMFVQAMLEGAAREASRYGLTGFTSGGVSRADQILAIVEDHTFGIVDMDELEMETLVYENFGDIGQPEPFTDQNGNGVWDNDEPFTDINGNGTWDPDMGAAGLGGPGDVVVYRMSYAWDIMIPLFEPFFGESITLQSNIAVRNEPFEAPPPPAPAP